jgi:hypothetical protein
MTHQSFPKSNLYIHRIDLDPVSDLILQLEKCWIQILIISVRIQNYLLNLLLKD